MASATKIFGERFERFYSDCAVKRCGCQITARARTDARYEALTYSENQALKTRDQYSQRTARKFGMRDSYRNAIQTGRSKPIKLKFTPKKSVANGLLSINVRRFLHFKWNYFQYECLEFVFRGFRLSSGALYPAFEEEDQTDICPIDQAIPVRDSNDNISSESTNSI